MTSVREIEVTTKLIIERTRASAEDARKIIPQLGPHPCHAARTISEAKLRELVRAAHVPRCPVAGCSVRYRGGPDRECPHHQDREPKPDHADAAALMAAPRGVTGRTRSATLST